MTESTPTEPISTDALNLYRITHPDKEIRPLITRLHRLSTASSSKTTDGDVPMEEPVESDEKGDEMELAKLDLLKWQRSVERIMGSVFNLQTQKMFYEEKAKQTVARTEELRIALQNEKLVLERKLRDREGMLKCDVVARKITSKGKSRADLDEQITELEESLAHHQSTNEAYIAVSQSRSDKFKEILKMVEEARNMKLPDVNVTSAEIEPEAMDLDLKEDTSMTKTDAERDTSGNGGRLNVTALPFQPQSSSSSRTTPANGSLSSPVSRAGTPGPSVPSPNTQGSSTSAAVQSAGSGSISATTPSGRHALPSRPSRQATSTSSTSRTNVATASLPSRPSNLRSVTTPKSGPGGSLEEGEVGGEEEGEVNERSASKRSGESGSRSTRRQ